MKKHVIWALIVPMAFACKDGQKKTEEMATEVVETIDEATPEMTSSDWVMLFDGKTFDGWQKFGGGAVPDAWTIEDGAMVLNPPEERPEGVHYDINTVKDYGNFELSLEWKISEGGNGGVFWGIQEGPEYTVPYVTGPEVQVLDNERHPDAKNGTSHQAGALYDLVSPTKDATKPVGEWNTMVIYVNYDEHKGHVDMNGERIVDFPLANGEWDALVAKSKFADWDGFGASKIGKIGVQDHGNVVAFRNIKIRELQ